MAADQMKVSVILCAYTLDRWDDLKQAVRSIHSQSVPPYEIILVIDHNPDLYRLALMTFGQVEVIENQEASGLSGARNSGIAHASGDIIAFMDEDAVAAPDWIKHLASEYQDPLVMGVGGRIRPQWAGSQPDWFPEEFYWVVGCSYKGLPQTTSPVRNLLGCNMSFRQEVFASAGGFRNGIGRIGTLPVGCEETELCIRASQQTPSAILLYKPEAKVYHKVPKWRSRWQYFLQRCFAEGLSKAQVTRLVGAGDGLSSERQYVMKTLLRAMIDGFTETIKSRRTAGIKRAAAISAGLSFTTIGYIEGLTVRSRQLISPSGVSYPATQSNQKIKQGTQDLF